MKCEKQGANYVAEEHRQGVILEETLPKSHEQDLVARHDMQHLSIFY